jgi:hypothetical protein
MPQTRPDVLDRARAVVERCLVREYCELCERGQGRVSRDDFDRYRSRFQLSARDDYQPDSTFEYEDDGLASAGTAAALFLWGLCVMSAIAAFGWYVFGR